MQQKKQFDGFIYCPPFDPDIHTPKLNTIYTSKSGKNYLFVSQKFMIHIIGYQDQLNSFWPLALTHSHLN